MSLSFPEPPPGDVFCDVCGRSIPQKDAVPIPAIGFMCPSDDENCTAPPLGDDPPWR